MHTLSEKTKGVANVEKEGKGKLQRRVSQRSDGADASMWQHRRAS
jgi:hypothetical protein